MSRRLSVSYVMVAVLVLPLLCSVVSERLLALDTPAVSCSTRGTVLATEGIEGRPGRLRSSA